MARLGADFEQARATLQRAREQALRHAQATKLQTRTESRLTTQLSQSEELRDDLLGVLQGLGLATILTDGQGRVTFISDEAAGLLNLSTTARVSDGNRCSRAQKQIATRYGPGFAVLLNSTTL